MFDVSVIVVNWNTKLLLRDCLASIYEQPGDVNYEVIVVDNASSDGSVEMVREEFPQIILVENSVNRGFAAANNRGIALAKGRYVLLLNSDTVVCDNAIGKTVRYADKHPEVAVVGCQVWENPQAIQMTCFRFPSILNLFLGAIALNRILKKNRVFGREWMEWWGRDSECQVDVVSGMFMLVRRQAIVQVGLMDESFFMYSEEADWCYRFSKAGWKVLFWPGAKIIHVDGGSYSSKQVAPEMHVQQHKSLLIFFRKHYGMIHYLLARLILVVSTGLRCLAWALMLLGKRIMGRNAAHELKENRKRWFVFKFCVFGSEP